MSKSFKLVLLAITACFLAYSNASAKTWWLPDWQGGQDSRGSADGGGGDIVKDDSDCMKHYNLYTKCPSPKLSTGVVHPVAGMTCQKSCYCPSEYKYTSSNCSGKYTVSGGSCDGKYNACVCKSEYSQNSSNCNGEYRPAGESCEGNYNRCEMRPECTVSSMSCTYGCAGYNSCDRCTSCKSNPDCDVSDKSCTYGCASYNSCSKCTSCKSNPDCSATAVSCDYGCASTNSCGICTSCSGNPDCNVSDKSCDCGCSSTNSCGKCTSCKSCPPSDPCSGVSCGANAYCSGGSCYCNSGYHKSGSACVKDEVHTHSYSCPSGYSSSNSWGSSAQTTSKTCSCGAASGTCYKAPAHTHSYSCPSGYQASSCSSSQTQTGTTAKVCSCGATSGTCYKCEACSFSSKCSGYDFVSCTYGIADSCTACGTTKYKCKADPCISEGTALRSQVSNFNSSARDSIAFCDAGCKNCNSYPMMMNCSGMRSSLISSIKDHNSRCNDNISTLLASCPQRGLCGGGGPGYCVLCHGTGIY